MNLDKERKHPLGKVERVLVDLLQVGEKTRHVLAVDTRLQLVCGLHCGLVLALENDDLVAELLARLLCLGGRLLELFVLRRYGKLGIGLALRLACSVCFGCRLLVGVVSLLARVDGVTKLLELLFSLACNLEVLFCEALFWGGWGKKGKKKRKESDLVHRLIIMELIR